jgi:hypothetical protein
MRWLTPFGTAGVAVVAFDASEVGAVLGCLRSLAGDPFELAAHRSPARAVLHLAGEDRDDVLVTARRSGLELHLHGSPAVQQALAARFAPTASPLPPSASLLRRAQALSQLQLAVEQSRCDLRLAVAAAAPAGDGSAFAAMVARSHLALAQSLPQRAVLIGAWNAGKSTLFNRLLGRERALVGSLAGLTRDAILEPVSFGGYPYLLVDTAGEGAAEAAIDVAAIAAGRALRGGALRILVIDGARGPARVDRELLPTADIVISTRADAPRSPWPVDVPRDLESGDGMSSADLRSRFGRLLTAKRQLPWPAPGGVGGPAALDGDGWRLLRAAATVAGVPDSALRATDELVAGAALDCVRAPTTA